LSPGEPDQEVDWDLVIHLVISHHGWGRPSVPVVGDSTHQDLTASIQGETVTVSADLARPDWEQPARFRRLCERYGLWGLAFLETLVRQADAAVSQVAAL
jgi:CRISPR-associated endonuclease/helicase Cas3